MFEKKNTYLFNSYHKCVGGGGGSRIAPLRSMALYYVLNTEISKAS